MSTLQKIRRLTHHLSDDVRGIALTSELILMSVVVLAGLTVASVALRDAVVSELSDVGGMTQDLKQEYLINGLLGHSSSIAGMEFSDSTDHCDDADDVAGAADNCITFDVPPTNEQVEVSGEDLIVKFDFDDGNADDSSSLGQDNSGTIVGDPEFIDGEIVFDGDDSISIANSPDINLGTHGTRTIAFDFNANDVDKRQVLYEEGAGVRGLVIYIDNGMLYIGGWNIPAGESGWTPTYISIPIVAGTDYNVALVLDGGATVTPGALTGYLNGSAFGSAPGSQLWQHGGGIGIGAINGVTIFHDGTQSSGANYCGSIDNFCMFDRALSSDEMATLGSE